MSDNNSLIDDDLVNESNKGLTNAFQDYNGDDFDLDYSKKMMTMINAGYTSVMHFKEVPQHEQENAKCIDFNGAEKDLLIGMKAVVNPTLATCEQLTGKPWDRMNAADFAAIYLNRKWYLLMQD